MGIRTVLDTPLLREGIAIGAIHIRRREVRPFSDRQIKLLETFADQAVIAIENARLIHEQQARNRELTEALEQQTATSEILGVIASSPTDMQPVLDAIVQRAPHGFVRRTMLKSAELKVNADALAPALRADPGAPVSNRLADVSIVATPVGRAMIDSKQSTFMIFKRRSRTSRFQGASVAAGLRTCACDTITPRRYSHRSDSYSPD